MSNFINHSGWIQTFTGRKFYPLNPRQEDIDIYDIAHSLANKCRFNGHCGNFYSVAEHSVLVSYHCSVDEALWGLLHDASEAYLPDVPRPLKILTEFAFFREAEKKVMLEVCKKFNLQEEEPYSVSITDKRLLLTECADPDLIPNTHPDWKPQDTLLCTSIPDVKLEFWYPTKAEIMFLKRFHELLEPQRFVFTRFNAPFKLGSKYEFRGTYMNCEFADRVKDINLFEVKIGDRIAIVEDNGAIVGNDLQQVKLDILNGDQKIIAEQSKQAAEMARQAIKIPRHEFIDRYSRIKYSDDDY